MTQIVLHTDRNTHGHSLLKLRIPQRVDNVTKRLPRDLGPAAKGAEHSDIRRGASGNITEV